MSAGPAGIVWGAAAPLSGRALATAAGSHPSQPGKAEASVRGPSSHQSPADRAGERLAPAQDAEEGGQVGRDQHVDAMASVVDDPIPPMRDFSAYMKATYGEANARVMTRSGAGAARAIMAAAGGDIRRSRAAAIACPTLLITGEHDFLATPTLASDMARAIPNGEVLVATGAGHLVHHEQPGWLVDTVVGWLSKR
jgi:pimeloyl-ACP methyl ester carboxylesterase